MAVTPSILQAHLDCEHRTWMDAFGDQNQKRAISAFQQMLFDEGLLHERRLVDEAGRGTAVVDLSELRREAKDAATRDWIAKGAPLIYQGRLAAGTLVGEPDLLRREGVGYVPIDIKSGAALEDDGSPKLKYGVQIALYVELLEANGTAAGAYGYIWDRHGHEIRYDVDAPITENPPVTLRSEYQRLRAAVEPVLDGRRRTEPAAGACCKPCVWKPCCHEELEQRDDLTLLSELGRSKRAALRDAFPTVQALASADLGPYLKKKGSPFPRIGADTLKTLQAKARLAKDPNPEPFFREAFALPTADVELFFDIEDCTLRDIVYLHGFVIRETGSKGKESFLGIFAEGVDADAERGAFAQAIEVFRSFPSAPVVHFSMHERTKYRELQRRYPDVCSAAEVEALFQEGRAVDLYKAAQKSIWPTRENSVKALAQYCGFEWRDENPSGAASVEWFHRYVTEGDEALKQRILDYNEDDCRAMRVVLDRMRGMGVRGL